MKVRGNQIQGFMTFHYKLSNSVSSTFMHAVLLSKCFSSQVIELALNIYSKQLLITERGQELQSG
jgi:hypothetical protein